MAWYDRRRETSVPKTISRTVLPLQELAQPTKETTEPDFLASHLNQERRSTSEEARPWTTKENPPFRPEPYSFGGSTVKA